MDPTDLEAISESLEQDSTLRQSLRDAAGEFEKRIRVMMANLTNIHSTPKEKRMDIVNSIETIKEACSENIAQIAQIVPENQFWRWKDIYSKQLQNYVFVTAMCQYLRSQRLVTLLEVSNALHIEIEWQNKVQVQVEDYLHGLIGVVSELARLAVNSVTMGDFEEPFRIFTFVKDLFAGFSMLNLKNDSLRKRFDGLKYDLKKVEEVVYDLSLRQLGPGNSTTAS